MKYLNLVDGFKIGLYLSTRTNVQRLLLLNNGGTLACLRAVGKIPESREILTVTTSSCSP